jgi:hypothetical protein
VKRVGWAIWLGAMAACGRAAIAPPPSTAVDSTFTLDGRQIAPSVLNRYIAEHLGFTSRGGQVDCAYLPLGQDSTRIYLNSLCLEFVPDADSFAVGSGRGSPVALRVGVEGDSVRVRSHETPVDGGGYLASVRRIFPPRLFDRITEGNSPTNRSDTLAAFLRSRAVSRLGSRRCYVGDGSILGRAPASLAPGPMGLKGWIEMYSPRSGEGGDVRLIDSDNRSLSATWRRLSADSVIVTGFNDFIRIELRVMVLESALSGIARATSDAAQTRDSAGRATPFRRAWKLVTQQQPCDRLPREIAR